MCVFGVVGCVCVLGTKKEDKKERVENGLAEQFYDSLTVEKKHLFFLSFFERNFTEERVARASFFIFFFALLFRCTALFFLSLFSLFSLKQLVCVFLLENSLHTNKLFGGGSKLQSSS